MGGRPTWSGFHGCLPACPPGPLTHSTALEKLTLEMSPPPRQQPVASLGLQVTTWSRLASRSCAQTHPLPKLPACAGTRRTGQGQAQAGTGYILALQHPAYTCPLPLREEPCSLRSWELTEGGSQGGGVGPEEEMNTTVTAHSH